MLGFPRILVVVSVIGDVNAPRVYPAINPTAKRVTLIIAKILLEIISVNSQ